VPSRVRAIEYQGSFVKVILDKIGDDELIAYVPDRVFYRDPFSIGDVVIAGWEKTKPGCSLETDCQLKIQQEKRE